MKETVRHEWMRLDNAALIYPAARSRNWTALFRFSATLTERVDPGMLATALTRTLNRFPSYRTRLRSGLFWTYFEKNTAETVPYPDVANPCVRMDLKENGGYMFRVRYHENRIAVEFFHALTDGTGGLCFLKTLVAEYLTLRYGAVIPRGKGILDCDEEPRAAELEDSFLRFARKETLPRGRNEGAAYCIRGTNTPHFMHIITGLIPVSAIKEKADAYGASIGELVTATLLLSIADVQARERSRRRRRQPVKINVPVNLRSFYPSETLRNFSFYINAGIEPRLGAYTFEEALAQVRHGLRLELDEKKLNARFTTNVDTVQNLALRIVPLPIKQFVMKQVFVFVGDRYSSSSVSNLGNTVLPDEMARYVTRMDVMLGPLYRNPVTCACLSYNGQAVITFTRTILESAVERGFFTRLVRMGIPVKIESNDPN